MTWVWRGREGRKEDSRAFLVCYPDNCLRKTDETAESLLQKQLINTIQSGNTTLGPGTVQDRNFEGSAYRKMRRLVQCCFCDVSVAKLQEVI